MHAQAETSLSSYWASQKWQSLLALARLQALCAKCMTSSSCSLKAFAVAAGTLRVHHAKPQIPLFQAVQIRALNAIQKYQF